MKTIRQLFYFVLIIGFVLITDSAMGNSELTTSDSHTSQSNFDLTVEVDGWYVDWKPHAVEYVENQDYKIETTLLQGLSVIGTYKGRSRFGVSYLTDSLSDKSEEDEDFVDKSLLLAGWFHEELSPTKQLYTRLLYGNFEGKLFPQTGKQIEFKTEWHTFDLLFATPESKGLWSGYGLRLSRYRKPLETTVDIMDSGGEKIDTELELFDAELLSISLLAKIMDCTHFGDFDNAQWYMLDAGMGFGVTRLKALSGNWEEDTAYRFHLDFDVEAALQYIHNFRFGGLTARLGYRFMYFIMFSQGEESSGDTVKSHGEHGDLFYGPFATISLSF